jgi:hypothetical protein
VIGPLALLVAWLGVRSARRRSFRTGAFALAVLVLETRWPSYRRLLRSERFRDLNLVMVFPAGEE